MDTGKSATTLGRISVIVVGAVLVLGLLYVSQAPTPSTWASWPADFCRAHNCYCEPIQLDRWVAQPLATYSNLGFMAVGLWVLGATVKRRSVPAGWLYGGVLITTGLFSFFYHASLTRVGDFLDLMGMYLFTSFLMLFNINRVRPMTAIQFGLGYAVINVALAVGLWLAYSFQQIYFVILIGGLLVAEVAAWRTDAGGDRRWLAAALGVFVLGAVVWVLDSNGGLPCNPTALYSWHAVWHLSAAGAAGLMYGYYQTLIFRRG
jgi:hypothetical protein